ncbi:MAG: GTPase [Planctomycetota bacterium]|nr:GTPase [Planctomycetota bacterium]
MFYTNDTIAAVSSAAGAAARSIVRLSGQEAIRLAGGVFSEPLDELSGFSSIAGTVAVNTPYPVSAPAIVYLFRSPRSYTRQDVAELHVPSEVVAAVVCAALIDSGARQAGAGEFTARAFFSGRLDLSAAEAVADIIDSAADAQLRSAVGVLDGALSRLCRPAAETLTEALALTEAAIDFADEDLPIVAADELASTVRKVADDLDGVLTTSGRWPADSSETRVAIAGRPNAGKSSLLNAVSGIDRAIISALAGTTRDVLTAPASLVENLRVTLMDAAGLEAIAENLDPLTLATHSAARQAVASARAVLFVIDAASDDHDADERLLAEIIELNRRAPLMILANKIDLVDHNHPITDDPFSRRRKGDEKNILTALRRLFDKEIFPVSALTGEGLDDLRKVLTEQLGVSASPQAGGLMLHDRQRRGISAAAAAARRSADLLATYEATDVTELAAVELRSALSCLAELAGEVTDEDVLSAIFSRFCVGK